MVQNSGLSAQPQDCPEDGARDTTVYGSGGLLYAILAYGSWGLFPVYWKQFGDISALEILSHRMIWSLVLLLGLLMALKRGPELRAVMRSRKTVGMLLVSATLLACN